MWLLLFIIAGIEVRLPPIEGSFPNPHMVWRKGTLSAGEPGLVIHDKKLIYLMYDANTPTKIINPELRVQYVLALQDGVFFLGEGQKGKLACYFTGKDGITQVRDLYFQLAEYVNGRLFLSIPHRDRDRNLYPPLIHELDPNTFQTRRTLFKAPSRLMHGSDQFLVTERNQVLMFMGNLTEEIYFINPAIAEREAKLGPAVQGIAPPHSLNWRLQGSQIANFTPNYLAKLEQSNLAWFQNRLRTSYSLLFQAWDEGYILVYETPDKLNGLYVGNHTAVQYFDQKFRPQGKTFHTFGQVAGIVDGALHIFHLDPASLAYDENTPKHVVYGYDDPKPRRDQIMVQITNLVRDRSDVYQPVLERVALEDLFQP